MLKPLYIQAQNIARLQLILIGVVSIGLWLCVSYNAGHDAFLGGMSYNIPNMLFLIFLVAFAQKKTEKGHVLLFFGGELVKLILAAASLAVLLYMAHSPLWCLIGFATNLLGFYITGIFTIAKYKVAAQ